MAVLVKRGAPGSW